MCLLTYLLSGTNEHVPFLQGNYGEKSGVKEVEILPDKQTHRNNSEFLLFSRCSLLTRGVWGW